MADPIEHVIVLTFENRSFDHMLGCLQSIKLKIDGIPADAAPRANEFNGVAYPQIAGAARIVTNDPIHEHPNVMRQLQPDANGKPNGGFVKDYAEAYPTKLSTTDRGEVMKFHDLDTLPALHACPSLYRLRPLVFLSARTDLDQPPVRHERYLAWSGQDGERDNEPKSPLVQSADHLRSPE